MRRRAGNSVRKRNSVARAPQYLLSSLTHACAIAALAFATAVARLDASWIEVGLLSERREGLPFVSIVVPARNEERSIEACVRSLLAQRWLDFELLVVDDRSTDATPAILARLAIEDDRLIVVRGEPLPQDWVGKPWAMHQGRAAARGAWLLFTDADSIHAALGVASALVYAIDARADALTLATYEEFGSFWEAAILPAVLGMILVASGPLDAINDPMQPGRALANGQYMLVRREALDALGGHAALRDKIVEDVEFARSIKQDGRFRLVLAGGSAIASVRMYHSFSEIWEGFTKNMALGVERPAAYYAFLSACGMLSFVPPLLAVAHLRRGRRAHAVEALACSLAVIAAASRGIARTGHPKRLALLHPLGMTMLAAIGLNSGMRWHSGRGVQWRGRIYGKRKNGDAASGRNGA